MASTQEAKPIKLVNTIQLHLSCNKAFEHKLHSFPLTPWTSRHLILKHTWAYVEHSSWHLLHLSWTLNISCKHTAGCNKLLFCNIERKEVGMNHRRSVTDPLSIQENLKDNKKEREPKHPDFGFSWHHVQGLVFTECPCYIIGYHESYSWTVQEAESSKLAGRLELLSPAFT